MHCVDFNKMVEGGDHVQIEYIKTEELIPYANNPRNNDGEAVDRVAASIAEYGFKNPIIIDKDNVIVAGHTRLKAAKKLHIEKVPTIKADDLTPAQIKAFRISDNKVAEYSSWDEELLAIELEGLQELDFDIDLTGFGELEFEELLNGAEEKAEIEQEAEEDEFDVDLPKDPVVKCGDVWRLGRHRLMCGDSTCERSINILTDGKVVDCVFTDPPYGMKKESEGVLNDNLNYDDLLEFNKKWIPLTLSALKDMGAWYCWGIDEPLMDIYSHILKPMARKNEIVIRNYLTWAKHTAFGMKSSLMLSYPRETEKCWFVVKGKNWNNNNAEFFNYKYQPVVDYLNEQAQLVGLNAKKLRQITGVQMWSHWFTHSQFTVIPEKHYKKLQMEYEKEGAFLKTHEQVRGMIGGQDEGKTPDKPHFDITWFDDGDIPLTDVWRNPITGAKERELTGDHATPKPIKICERAIITSTKKGETILDVFGGSGSTLVACEQLNRTCYMMELDPRYCDVIINRWETLTGEKAVRV